MSQNRENTKYLRTLDLHLIKIAFKKLKVNLSKEVDCRGTKIHDRIKVE